MKQVMLDTDILSEFFRGNTNVIHKLDEYIDKYSFISISVITYYEILNGLLYKDAKRQLNKFENFVKFNKVVPLNIKVAQIAAEKESELKTLGKQIGHTDTLIAGTAIANNLVLITNNTNHFKRVKNLEIDNWVNQTTQTE